MNFKITGFADEIDQSLSIQVDSMKKLGISHIEMRGVDGNNLIYHTNEKIAEIKKVLDDNNISLSALGTPLGKIGITDDFEPHLFNFAGLEALEAGDNKTNIKESRTLTGFEAFSLAHESLMKICRVYRIYS